MILEKFNLTGKKAIVTGGGKGLGRSMATALYEAGAQVVLVDVLDLVKDTAAEIGRNGAGVHAVIGNLMNRHDLDRVFQEALDMLGGRLDILVNNAGINCKAPTIGYKSEDWDRIIAINLTAPFLLCQKAGAVMTAQKYGRIINISSVVGVIGGLNNIAYSSSKGAIAAMTRTLSNEWAGMGVNVNAIAPGYINTDINRTTTSEEKRAYIRSRIPNGEWGEAIDIQGAVVFLSSDAAKYVTGVVLPVDGGFLSR